ncbi:hypothetical protein GGI35DRAFT_444902 [Trichoderma velutinum]
MSWDLHLQLHSQNETRRLQRRAVSDPAGKPHASPSRSTHRRASMILSGARSTPCDSTPSYASGPRSSRDGVPGDGHVLLRNTASKCSLLLRSVLHCAALVRARVPAAQALHALLAAAGCITLKCGCMAHTCL